MKPFRYTKKGLALDLKAERYRRQDKDFNLWIAFALMAMVYGTDLLYRVVQYFDPVTH